MFDCGGTRRLAMLIGIARTRVSGSEKSPPALRAISERHRK
jgi:hypothetical protein